MATNWRRPKTHIGRLLRKHRRSLSITQAEAAKRVGYGRQHYNRLENGSCLLALDAIYSVADGLGIPDDVLTQAALADRMPVGWEAVQA